MTRRKQKMKVEETGEPEKKIGTRTQRKQMEGATN